ncbi:MAG: hypothetical protein GF355_07750 [Candidatus Eisenbacteria bacterium]|nr:hypothetical protein [Candidatus Eisenbacteria bacterium]
MFGGKKNPEEISRKFLEDVNAIWPERDSSVILYGSAARGDFRPGRSDVNFLVVVEDLSPEKLRRTQSRTKDWRRERVATPLFLRRKLIQTSLDSYPLEFLSMMASYRVLQGEDALADLKISSDDVRLQCEREVKSKLLLLREAYVESGGSRHVMRDIVAQSLPAMTAIFQGLLYLQGKPWKLWRDELLTAGQEAFQLDAELFRELWKVKRQEVRPGADRMHEIMGRYLVEMERLADWADRGGLKHEERTGG